MEESNDERKSGRVKWFENSYLRMFGTCHNVLVNSGDHRLLDQIVYGVSAYHGLTRTRKPVVAVMKRHDFVMERTCRLSGVDLARVSHSQSQWDAKKGC